MPDLFERVRQHWLREDAGIAAERASREEISEWEARYNVVLSDDLRAYVMKLNGTLHGECLDFGTGCTSFLPLKAIVPEHDFDGQYNGANMFVFADYFISCYWWCAEITSQPRERTRIFLRGGKLKLVAESLEEFLEAYMEDSRRIHVG